jgi:hypothetical protein
MHGQRLSLFSRNHKTLVSIGVFVLTCGLAACDLPGGRANEAERRAIEQLSQEEVLAIESQPVSRVLTASVATTAPTASASVAPLGEELDFSEVAITPMEKSGDPDANALLEVRFEDGKSREDGIKLTIDDRSFLLVRDASDPTLFSGLIAFDFDRFTEEQVVRQEEIKQIEAGLDPTPVDPVQSTQSTSVSPQRLATKLSNPAFSGRANTGSTALTIITPDEIATARSSSTRIRIPPGSIAMHFSTVDPRRELMITDLSVVNDRNRTFDICGNVGNPNGAWTFKTLMTNMANQPVTGIDPAVFVENWVRNWTVNHSINTFAVPARANIGPQVLNAWPRLSNGRLNLDRSPFRLLAIVNRVDLRKNTVYGGGSQSQRQRRLLGHAFHCDLRIRRAQERMHRCQELRAAMGKLGQHRPGQRGVQSGAAGDYRSVHQRQCRTEPRQRQRAESIAYERDRARQPVGTA